MFHVKETLKYCCDKLNLPIPKFIIKEMKKGIAGFNYTDNYIFINKRLLRKFRKDNLKSFGNLVGCNFRTSNELRFFVLAHECAHYFQSTRFPKWRDRYYKEYEKFILPSKIEHSINVLKKYNELKLEKNANKISSILFSMAKKQRFFLIYK